MKSAIELLNIAIQDLECRLGLQPGEEVSGVVSGDSKSKKNDKKKKGGDGKKKNTNETAAGASSSPEELANQPEICKLEFKVGVIVKVWNHPNADKLYCEEIDVGEEEPRQIASGLRPHFTLDQMMGQRLLVVSNLKAKNLVKFKSHGMVLCSAQAKDDGSGEEIVKFVEPPETAKIGESVIFQGLPKPRPLPPSQIEKKKVFKNVLDGLKTDENGIATWNGHKFMVGSEFCKSELSNAAMR